MVNTKPPALTQVVLVETRCVVIGQRRRGSAKKNAKTPQ